MFYKVWAGLYFPLADPQQSCLPTMWTRQCKVGGMRGNEMTGDTTRTFSHLSSQGWHRQGQGASGTPSPSLGGVGTLRGFLGQRCHHCHQRLLRAGCGPLLVYCVVNYGGLCTKIRGSGYISQGKPASACLPTLLPKCVALSRLFVIVYLISHSFPQLST